MLPLLRKISSISLKSRMASLSSPTPNSFSKLVMDSSSTPSQSTCFGGSHRLMVLAQQLRMYKPPPIPDEIEEQKLQESAGRKVVSQVGFLESATPVAHQPERFRPKRAAVLICLFEGDAGEFRVILTKRSSRLSTHSGEVALPGGKAEETDANDVETATREAKEEIGLDPSLVNVVTCLEPFLSKFLAKFWQTRKKCKSVREST